MAPSTVTRPAPGARTNAVVLPSDWNTTLPPGVVGSKLTVSAIMSKRPLCNDGESINMYS